MICKPTQQELLDYLYSHIELEHILMDAKEKFNTEYLESLNFEDLDFLADDYDYYEGIL